MNTSVLLHLNSWAVTSAAARGVVRFFAHYAIGPVAIGLGLLLLREVRRRSLLAAVPTAVVLATSFLLGVVAASAHAERRPFQDHPLHLLISHDPGQSFPSDHATAAFACAFAGLLLSRAWGALLLVIAVAIAVARVAAGVHYPDDVLGSLLVAAIGGAGGVLVRRLLDARHPAMLAR